MPDVISVTIPRWIPLLLAAMGTYGSAKLGAPGITDLINVAKIGATRYELASLAHHIHLDVASGFSIPDPNKPDTLQPYIRKAAYSLTGRDPSIDYWGQPYTMSAADPEVWQLRSFGPNAVQDLCMQDVSPAAAGLESGAVADPGPPPADANAAPADRAAASSPARIQKRTVTVFSFQPESSK